MFAAVLAALAATLITVGLVIGVIAFQVRRPRCLACGGGDVFREGPHYRCRECRARTQYLTRAELRALRGPE